MTPNRIIPDLQCSLLCEEVRQESNGNFLLIGIIDVIRVPQLPVTAFKLSVFNRWTAGIGQFTETLRFVFPPSLNEGDLDAALGSLSVQWENIAQQRVEDYRRSNEAYGGTMPTPFDKNAVFVASKNKWMSQKEVIQFLQAGGRF